LVSTRQDSRRRLYAVRDASMSLTGAARLAWISGSAPADCQILKDSSTRPIRESCTRSPPARPFMAVAVARNLFTASA
jgi:hypothetical protein